MLSLLGTAIDRPSLIEVVVRPNKFPNALLAPFLESPSTIFIDFKGDIFNRKKNCAYFLIFSIEELKNILSTKIEKNSMIIIDNLFILNFMCKSTNEKKECYSLFWENIYKKNTHVLILNRYKDGESKLYIQRNWDYLVSYVILDGGEKIIKK